MHVGLKTGLCRIRAVTPVIPDSGYGDNTKREYASLKEALSRRYGLGKEIEYLRSGALWRESNEWMWSLYDKERVQSVLWDAIEHVRTRGIFEQSNLRPSESLPPNLWFMLFMNSEMLLNASRRVGP